MSRAQKTLVRVPGEGALFDLARAGSAGSSDALPRGVLPRMLTVTLGSRTQPGSCARLVSAMAQSGRPSL
jgi:hypothetical protein